MFEDLEPHFPIGPVTGGKLLVASPGLQDPNFFGSVILLIDHGQDGTFGLILNQPAIDADEQTMVQELWAQVGYRPAENVTFPVVPFMGGPVESSSPFLLTGEQAEDGWRIQITSKLQEEGADGTFARVFLGHAGWSGGQLDRELRGGSWIVVDSDLHDLFTNRPEDLWFDVLQRQGGLFQAATLYPNLN